MKEVAREIFIRVVSGVLVILIVVFVLEYLRKRKKCGCGGEQDKQLVPDQQQMPWNTQFNSNTFSNPFGIKF